MTKTHTIQEAAALTCYGLDALKQMVASGDIPGAELRGGIWFLPDEWVRAKIPPPGWVSPQERADQEGVSREAIHRRIARGDLPVVRRGAKKVFVPPVEWEGQLPEEIQEWEREKILSRGKWVVRRIGKKD